MTTTLRFIEDAGHGWLEVPLAEFPDALKFGTGFGYTDGRNAYLEEDCEYGAFMAAHGGEGIEIVTEYHRGDWHGRSLPRIPDYSKVGE